MKDGSKITVPLATPSFIAFSLVSRGGPFDDPSVGLDSISTPPCRFGLHVRSLMAPSGFLFHALLAPWLPFVHFGTSIVGNRAFLGPGDGHVAVGS